MAAHVGSSDAPPGPPPPPPPPPPPMPGSGAIPAVRLNSEIAKSGPPPSAGGGKHLPGGGAPFSYIPPSAIQNAMATKDKKPFTYTPGGIDFLAEIRSPRMQRRISKNAMDEGVNHQPAPPPQQQAQQQQQSPVQLSPQAVAAMQPQIAVPVFPVAPPMPATPLHHVHHAPQPPPPPPAALRVNLKPAVPQFLTQHSPQTQPAPPQFEQTADVPDSRPARTPPAANDPPLPPPPPPVRATTVEKAPPTLVARPVEKEPSAPLQPAEKAPSTSSPSSESSARGQQLGSIYVPPVMNNAGPSQAQAQSPAVVIPSVQLSKAPMPWMNSQSRPSNSSTPPYVNPQPVERIIQIAREDEPKPASPTPPAPSSNVRVIPIAVEGRPTPPPPAAPAKKEEAKKEEVQLPWLTMPGKVVPIHLESCTPASPAQRPTPQPQQHQNQEQPPWRTQAAANANQIAAMMEELMSPASPTPRPASQPTQSRSFRILQMIHDPTEDNEGEQADASGRLSRCSVGSNTSSGSGGRMSHPLPPPGERKLHLTQDDRELMDMFRSQGNQEGQQSNGRPSSHSPASAAGASSQGASPARSRVSASEQGEAEPRKYTGANIPSRSFRMLQAMTSLDPNEGQSEL